MRLVMLIYGASHPDTRSSIAGGSIAPVGAGARMDSLIDYNFRIGPVGAGPSAFPDRVARHDHCGPPGYGWPTVRSSCSSRPRTARAHPVCRYVSCLRSPQPRSPPTIAATPTPPDESPPPNPSEQPIFSPGQASSSSCGQHLYSARSCPCSPPLLPAPHRTHPPPHHSAGVLEPSAC